MFYFSTQKKPAIISNVQIKKVLVSVLLTLFFANIRNNYPYFPINLR